MTALALGQLPGPESPRPDDDDPDRVVGWILTGLLVAAAVVAALYLAFVAKDTPPPADPTVDYAVIARRWADTVPLRISGVRCDAAGRCTVVTEAGVPVAVQCNATTCALERCP